MNAAGAEGVLASSTPSLPADVSALIDGAREAERLGNRNQARERYEAAIRRLPRSGHAADASALLRWVGRSFMEEAALDVAHDCFEVALVVAQLASDRSAAAHAMNNMAATAQQSGDLDTAEQHYRAALRDAMVAKEHRLVAMIQQNLGTIANIRGDMLDALRYYRASLATYHELGLSGHAAALLNNLGMLLTDLGRWRAAERTFGEAHRISSDRGDVGVQLMVEVNRAELWIERRRFELARSACMSALDLARRIGDTRITGEVYKHLGVIARETGSFDESADHFSRATTAAETRRDPLLEAETARERGVLHWRQERGPETLRELSRAHRLFSQLRARRDLADVKRRLGDLETSFLEIVRKWGSSIESKDRYTSGHCERVAEYACAIARASGYDEPALFWLRAGALLHDVGKIVVPSEVLNKRGPLSPAERVLMERHPVAGEGLLSGIEFPWDVRPMVRHHHERWDGTGYPDGLSGESIPLAARILCLADVFDALTTDRPYRQAFSWSEALIIMRAESGRMFDPALFPRFEELMSRDESDAIELPTLSLFVARSA
ncbi:MAG TPA: HD domain-containing phosphohydrolase [Gemmatimonadaceae bacterium]|nr:HD domain-containing phosphohydrolase [Gemmatimonadaceae bacterium]